MWQNIATWWMDNTVECRRTFVHFAPALPTWPPRLQSLASWSHPSALCFYWRWACRDRSCRSSARLNKKKLWAFSFTQIWSPRTFVRRTPIIALAHVRAEPAVEEQGVVVGEDHVVAPVYQSVDLSWRTRWIFPKLSSNTLLVVFEYVGSNCLR